MISGVALEIHNENLGWARFDVHGEKIFGLVGVFGGFETEIFEILEGFFVVEAAFDCGAIAIALD